MDSEVYPDEIAFVDQLPCIAAVVAFEQRGERERISLKLDSILW